MLISKFPQPLIKSKPWGREIWFAWNKHYAGKILEIKKGQRLSLQLHKIKTETQYLLSGRVLLTFGSDLNNLQEKILTPGMVFHVKPKTLHRLQGLTRNSQIFEVSTPELNDVCKLADDYGRKGTGNNSQLDNQLAQQLVAKKSKILKRLHYFFKLLFKVKKSN